MSKLTFISGGFYCTPSGQPFVLLDMNNGEYYELTNTLSLRWFWLSLKQNWRKYVLDKLRGCYSSVTSWGPWYGDVGINVQVEIDNF